MLYRVFLRDGGMLVSYGEFAHMGDRVVLSIPIGGTNSSPVLHLVTIQSADVDWDRTNAYAQAARSRRYADTRGEIDYGKLTRDVADALFQAGSVADPAKRLALAEAARKQLVEWPQQHYGYRAEEIAQMSAWLDQVVSELRVAAGQSRFELTLVASTPAAAPPVQLLPSPDFRERVDFALVAARKTTDSAERVSLLRAVLDSLQPVAPAGSWMASLHADVSGAARGRVEDRPRVRGLSRSRLSPALPGTPIAPTSADWSRSSEACSKRTPGCSGHDRPMSPDFSRRSTRGSMAPGAFVSRTMPGCCARRCFGPIGRKSVREWTACSASGIWLTDVRQLAGPSPDALRRLAYDAESAGHQLAKVRPPAEVAQRALHAWLAASRMAVRAAQGAPRRAALGEHGTGHGRPRRPRPERCCCWIRPSSRTAEASHANRRRRRPR